MSEKISPKQILRNEIQSSALSDDVKALATLLTYEHSVKDPIAEATRLINRFGGIPPIFYVSGKELVEVEEMSRSEAVLIRIVALIRKRCILSRLPQHSKNISVYNTVEKLIVLMTEELLCEPQETFCIALFDKDKKLLSTHKQQISLCDHHAFMNFFPGKLLSVVLRYSSAAYIVIAHRHAGDNLAVSLNDITATEYLQSYFSPLGVSLVDHIICGDHTSLSMIQSGMINKDSVFFSKSKPKKAK